MIKFCGLDWNFVVSEVKRNNLSEKIVTTYQGNTDTPECIHSNLAILGGSYYVSESCSVT